MALPEMDPIILTPRLKLTRITKAERGSPEFGWLHELYSNEKSTWWGLHGRAESVEETERRIKGLLSTNNGEEKTYKVSYAVHKILDSMSSSVEGEPHPAEKGGGSTEFIGLVNVISLGAGSLALPEALTLPTAAAATTLTVELSYTLLPIAWGKGYATESVKAVLESCKRASSFWTPFSKLYVRAIVHGRNPASMRVMDKAGMVNRGIYVWSGNPIFIGGEWEARNNLHIYGMHLLG